MSKAVTYPTGTYPLDELLAMMPPRPVCQWGAYAEAYGCDQPPAYRCVLTGPDDVGDLCCLHVGQFAQWVNREVVQMPWLGMFAVVPLEPGGRYGRHEPVIGRLGYDQRCPACQEREVATNVMGGVVCMACGWASRASEDNSR